MLSDTVNPAGWIPSSVSSNLCLFMEKQCVKPNTRLSDHTVPAVWIRPRLSECARVGGVSWGVQMKLQSWTHNNESSAYPARLIEGVMSIWKQMCERSLLFAIPILAQTMWRQKTKGVVMRKLTFHQEILRNVIFLRLLLACKSLSKFEKCFIVGTLFSNWRMSLNVFQRPC